MTKLAVTHGLVEEELITGQVVGAEHAAEHADGALEQVDVLVRVHLELVRHVVARLLELCDKYRKIIVVKLI